LIRYHARWVVPITSPPVENGTVVVDAGHIAYVGPRSGAPRGHDRDLGDVALLPGLVNTHTHLELTAMRGSLEDLDFHEWIARLRASRNSVVSEELALDSARWGIIEALRCGTTTIADTSAGGMSASAIAEAGIRGVMYQEVFGPDPVRCDAMMQELRDRIAELRRHESELLSIGVSPHAPYTVSDRLYVEAARFAATGKMPLAVHVAESSSESQLVVDACGPFADALRGRSISVDARARSPVELLERAGVLGPRTLLIHCVQVDSADISTIAAAGCGVAHCPVSNAKFGHGIAPLLEFLEAGIAVGIGSDSVASNNRMDLLEEARAAVLLQRVRSGRADALGARAALRLVTLGGAEALGFAARVGSLEPGKEADLAAFSLADTAPLGDPESALIYSLYQRNAVFVAVAGKVLVDDSAVMHETPGLRQRVVEAGEALARWHVAAAAG
jgi:cytosine/adenosine deaminase-related metal-dependent hydrolase